MSVLIKGMEMPNSCYLCCFYNGLGCSATKKIFPMFTNVAIRREDCPIVEIHPHGRLIDADALIADIRTNSESYFADDFAHKWVDVAPTIIEAEEGE